MFVFKSTIIIIIVMQIGMLIRSPEVKRSQKLCYR